MVNNLRMGDAHYSSGSGAEATGSGGYLQRIWRRFENSSIPLGLKWSLSIAGLIVVTMGILGSYLIQHQESSYRGQFDRFSQVVVDQLGRVAGEPLMAGDSLTLQILLQRHAQSPLILGSALYDSAGDPVAETGVAAPPQALEAIFGSGGRGYWDWEARELLAVSYASSVMYQDVTAGYLVVSVDRSPLERDLRETWRMLVMSTLLITLFGVLMASVLAHRLSRPIEHLARAGAALGAAEAGVVVERRDEIGQVLATFQRLASDNQQRNHAEAALSRYVSPQVAERVLANGNGGDLGGSCVTGSVLFCDIVGFTELSEHREPTEVAALLNDYFGYFALAAQSCGGTVDKFIGDCIMIVFGVPAADPHHALHAMTCGLLLQQLTRRINTVRQAEHAATVRLRVGISSGQMLAGNLGSMDRMQYTVVGDTVNVAARLCGMAEPGGVMLTGGMLQGGFPGDLAHYRDMGLVRLRGRKGGVALRAMDVDAVARDVNADLLIDRILSVATR